MSHDAKRVTLEQIDGVVWSDPPADATRLMRTVHALRRKSIDCMTAEDLRILLGQQESIRTLVPCALKLLEQNPLAQGDLYPGDLLAATLCVADEYWTESPDLAARLGPLVDRLHEAGDLDDHFPPDNQIWTRINQLRKIGVL
ncbi:contact-dependent growth inhibition system immunity protein [Nocardia colli]|uniref:contact-dependent growth inhibition system immunity protein n=1 Tax=Nocardia colli TaxID=2545717 RepID=UPI0035DEE475